MIPMNPSLPVVRVLFFSAVMPLGNIYGGVLDVNIADMLPGTSTFLHKNLMVAETMEQPGPLLS